MDSKCWTGVCIFHYQTASNWRWNLICWISWRWDLPLSVSTHADSMLQRSSNDFSFSITIGFPSPLFPFVKASGNQSTLMIWEDQKSLYQMSSLWKICASAIFLRSSLRVNILKLLFNLNYQIEFDINFLALSFLFKQCKQMTQISSHLS